MTNGLEFLANMEYPGRFIIAGKSFDNKFLVVSYGITGRSPPSKARKFVEEKNTRVIRTEVTDEEQLKKGSPALLMYPAVVSIPGGAVVASNGAQTKLLYTVLNDMRGYGGPDSYWAAHYVERAMKGPSFEHDTKDDRWIDITTFEPDAPNNTPRISLIAFPLGACFYIVKNKGGIREDSFYPFDLYDKGKGRFISTYNGENRNPLPAFIGDPLELRIPGANPKETTDAIFDSLNPDVRVAVATMYVNGDNVLTNMKSIHDRTR